MRRGLLLPTALFLVLAIPAAGQEPSSGPSREAAMQRFDPWVGKWTGSGWSIDATGKRIEFNLVESVERRVGGTALLIEGRGTATPDTGKARVTHEGLTLLYFDEHTGRYRWSGREFTSGTTVDTDVTPEEGGLWWSIKVGERGAVVRFTIHYDEKHWREVGESSADGTSWSTFMEMKLERARP